LVSVHGPHGATFASIGALLRGLELLDHNFMQTRLDDGHRQVTGNRVAPSLEIMEGTAACFPLTEGLGSADQPE